MIIQLQHATSRSSSRPGRKGGTCEGGLEVLVIVTSVTMITSSIIIVIVIIPTMATITTSTIVTADDGDLAREDLEGDPGCLPPPGGADPSSGGSDWDAFL